MKLMYLGIDIGGTKTLVAAFSPQGNLETKQEFATPASYADFLRLLSNNIALLGSYTWDVVGVAFPGKIDRANGIGLFCGNLSWQNVPIRTDLSKMLNAPIYIDNDANLGGLSEAIFWRSRFRRVLYVTISTGIGTGFIVDQKIEPNFADSEGGQMILEHNGKMTRWEKFASGKAIVKQFNQQASQITDANTWKIIAQNISIGLLDLCAVMQPQLIVLGGSVSVYFEQFRVPLESIMQAFSTPLAPTPLIVQAKRPKDAVIYGCYELAKSLYGKTY